MKWTMPISTPVSLRTKESGSSRVPQAISAELTGPCVPSSVDPGERAHQDRDPERQQHEDQHQPLGARARRAHRIGDGVAQQQREHRRDRGDAYGRHQRLLHRRAGEQQRVVLQARLGIGDAGQQHVAERHEVEHHQHQHGRQHDQPVGGGAGYSPSARQSSARQPTSTRRPARARAARPHWRTSR